MSRRLYVRYVAGRKTKLIFVTKKTTPKHWGFFIFLSYSLKDL